MLPVLGPIWLPFWAFENDTPTRLFSKIPLTPDSGGCYCPHKRSPATDSGSAAFWNICCELLIPCNHI